MLATDASTVADDSVLLGQIYRWLLSLTANETPVTGKFGGEEIGAGCESTFAATVREAATHDRD